MILFTLQRKSVYSKLIEDGIYYAGENPDLKPEYDKLKSALELPASPVFCSVIDCKTNLYGVADDANVLLELEVDETRVKLMEYYDWTDFLYFVRIEPDEQISGELMKGIISQKEASTYDVLQAVIPYIIREDVRHVYKVDNKFFGDFVGNGGLEAITRNYVQRLMGESNV